MKVLPARKMAIAPAATTAKIGAPPFSAKPIEFNQRRQKTGSQRMELEGPAKFGNEDTNTWTDIDSR